MDAERLLNEAEQSWLEAFDKQPRGESFTIGEHLQNITEKLGDIEEEMEREFDFNEDIR